MRLRAPAALGLAALSLAACGGSGGENAAPGGAANKTIAVGEADYSISPASIQVDEPGQYTFHVVNNGNVTHILEVEGNGVEEKTATLPPRASANLHVELGEDGEYELYCPIKDHRQRGMEARLTVGGGTGSNETTTSGGYSY